MKSSTQKTTKFLTGFIVAIISATSQAGGTASVSMSVTPGNVLIFSDGSGSVAGEYFGPLTVAQFGNNSGIGITDKLTSVHYTVASYPGAISDTPQLCYYTPYNSKATKCIFVSAGFATSTDVFNNLSFGPGAEISIVHKIVGMPKQNLKPSGKETVIFGYSY